MRPAPVLVLAATLVRGGSASLVAQERSERDSELTGHVVSAATAEPIAGAWVGLQGWERGTYSWRDGHFRLPRMPAGPRRYSVQALGYLPSLITLDPTTGKQIVELEPDASLQPGLAFLFDHLENRRNGGRLFDRQALAFSRAFDLGELLATRGVRGIRKFCLDERYAPGLERAPPEAFYQVEIHGRTVRAYTEEFLGRTAREDADAIQDIIRLRQPMC